LQAPWVNRLADGLLVEDIETFHRVITALRTKLEGADEPAKASLTASRRTRLLIEKSRLRPFGSRAGRPVREREMLGRT